MDDDRRGKFSEAWFRQVSIPIAIVLIVVGALLAGRRVFSIGYLVFVLFVLLLTFAQRGRGGRVFSWLVGRDPDDQGPERNGRA
jgi:hypothetical protein